MNLESPSTRLTAVGLVPKKLGCFAACCSSFRPKLRFLRVPRETLCARRASWVMACWRRRAVLAGSSGSHASCLPEARGTAGWCDAHHAGKRTAGARQPRVPPAAQHGAKRISATPGTEQSAKHKAHHCKNTANGSLAVNSRRTS